jgi:ketosteroid isomerase-like protein
MSQENVETIQALIPPPEIDLAPIFRDDELFEQTRAAFEHLIDPDTESVAAFLGGVTYVGVGGFRRLWLDWLEPWATYHTRIDELIDAGDSVVALVRDRGRRHDMDAEVELIGGSVWELRDGRIVRVSFLASRAEALEAAGLSE